MENVNIRVVHLTWLRTPPSPLLGGRPLSRDSGYHGAQQKPTARSAATSVPGSTQGRGFIIFSILKRVLLDYINIFEGLVRTLPIYLKIDFDFTIFVTKHHVKHNALLIYIKLGILI